MIGHDEGPPDVASRIPSIVVKTDSWQSGCMHEPAGKQETKSLGAVSLVAEWVHARTSWHAGDKVFRSFPIISNKWLC